MVTYGSSIKKKCKGVERPQPDANPNKTHELFSIQIQNDMGDEKVVR